MSAVQLPGEQRRDAAFMENYIQRLAKITSEIEAATRSEVFKTAAVSPKVYAAVVQLNQAVSKLHDGCNSRRRFVAQQALAASTRAAKDAAAGVDHAAQTRLAAIVHRGGLK